MGAERRRIRYAICGLSTRAVGNFLLPLLGRPSNYSDRDFSSLGEVVGVLDADLGRVGAMNRKCGTKIPAYGAADLRVMIDETKPDVLLVATPDAVHGEAIVAGLEAGLDVVAEKPMVASAEQARKVLEAEAKSVGRVRVAFNYRYGPFMRAARRFIRDGKLGRIANIDFNYFVDTQHGSSYFFRWNRERKNSGGLCIHKGCHHFDLAAWLIGDRPERVFAFGRRNFYGPDGWLRPRDEHGNPLPGVEERVRCPYDQRHWSKRFAPTQNPGTGWDPLDLPYDHQYPADKARYIYDGVIDSEDTYSAMVAYRGGASLAYSCVFSAPFSGYRLGITGSKGRLEVNVITQTFAEEEVFEAYPKQREIVFYPIFGGRQPLAVVTSQGGHGGADPLLQQDLFGRGVRDEAVADLDTVSTALDGAMAVATGEAVWRSIQDGRPYSISELLAPFDKP